MQPTVSVVVPCYNVADCVGDAIESIVDQAYHIEEIICVDDGSTDGTLAVLRDLEENHAGTIRVLTGPNRGAPAARNRGLEEAKGDYIQFLDADDVLASDKIAHQAGIIRETHAHVDVVAGAYRRILLNGSERIVMPRSANAWVALAEGRLGITSANLWKAQSIRDVGGWNPDWQSSQEYELMFRLLKDGGHVFVDEEIRTTLYERRDSISSDFTGQAFLRYVRLRIAILEYVQGREFLTEDELGRIQETVFTLLRRLHRLDRTNAVAHHERVFPSGYIPPVSPGNTRTYIAVLKLIGFDLAERARSIILSIILSSRKS